MGYSKASKLYTKDFPHFSMKQALEWLSLVASLLEREAYIERRQIINASNPNMQAKQAATTTSKPQYDTIVAIITERAQLFLRNPSMKIRHPPTIAMQPLLNLMNYNNSSPSSVSLQSQNLAMLGVQMNDIQQK